MAAGRAKQDIDLPPGHGNGFGSSLVPALKAVAGIVILRDTQTLSFRTNKRRYEDVHVIRHQNKCSIS